MATNLTFTSLKADVANYLERGGSAATDATVYAQIPRLINAAERKLANALKLQGQIEVLIDTRGLQAENPVVTKPDRWRGTVSMAYGASGAASGARTILLPRGYEYAITYWPDPSLTDPNNPPCFYSDYDLSHWYITPTPDKDYPLQSIVYSEPPLLDDSNETNFWTNYTPDLLLYGALLEAEPFLKDDARVQTWQTYWQQEIQFLNAQDLQKILDRAAQRKAP